MLFNYLFFYQLTHYLSTGYNFLPRGKAIAMIDFLLTATSA
jgi:hypothetical protein